MIRVLTVDAAGELWGSERSLLDFVQHYPAGCIAVCCPPRTPLAQRLQAMGVKVFPYFVSNLHRKSRLQRLWAALGVVRACAEFAPRLIHLNQSGSFRVSGPASILFRLPIVAHVRIFEDAPYLAGQGGGLRRLGAIVAISKSVASELHSFSELAAIPVHCLYDGYAWTPAEALADDTLQRRLACSGRVLPIKGQDLLVEAAGLLRSGGEAVEVELIGDGDPEFIERIKRLATERGVALRCAGFVPDAVAALAGHPVAVCPSYREPLGRAVFDAWAAGAVPIVFEGSGGAAEVIEEARGGIAYRTQSAESLADAIRSAWRLTPAERAGLIRNGREWLMRNCAPAAYADALRSVFEAACRLPRETTRSR